MAMHEDTARFMALILDKKGSIYFGLPHEAVADFKESTRDILIRRPRKPAPDEPTPAMLVLELAKLHHDMCNFSSFSTISAMVMASEVDKMAQFTAAQLLVMLPGPKIMDHYNDAARLIVQRAESPGSLQPVALATLYHIKAQQIPLEINRLGF